MKAERVGTTVGVMTRRASADDVHEICVSLPEVELGTSWGDRPTYKVRGRGASCSTGRRTGPRWTRRPVSRTTTCW